MFLRRATNQGRRLFTATSTRAFSIAPTTRPSSKVAGGVASAFVAAACLVAAGTREDKQSHAAWFKKTNYTKIKNEVIIHRFITTLPYCNSSLFLDYRSN